MGNLTAKQVFSNPVHFLAYGFGAGLSPRAPGTMGTLAAVPLYLLLTWLGPWIYAAGLIVALVAGVFICGYTAEQLETDDPGPVVWDEVAGYLLTMLGLPFGAVWMLAGFALFRLFDIWKPWPIRWLDRRIKGGLGIMLDDAVAAVFAGLLLHVTAYFLKA
ncbi:MAG: phosphatidylglycerophosphatase A [Bacillota bacterium]